MMFSSKYYYVLWTVSMCTTSLHSKFCEIVLWYECTMVIWMDYLLQIICTSCHPGGTKWNELQGESPCFGATDEPTGGSARELVTGDRPQGNHPSCILEEFIKKKRKDVTQHVTSWSWKHEGSPRTLLSKSPFHNVTNTVLFFFLFLEGSNMW